jgi:beta-galactosidase
LDNVEQPLGIRTLRIDPNTGFHLNGRPLRLRGVSKHQDLQGKSWAIDHADMRRDFALIREIGANTIRFAHYQHDGFVYDLADRNGFIAWAEIPLVDRTGPEMAANAEQHLRELIRQNYNHPSIAVWSIGNEVNLDAARGRVTSNAGPLLKQLNEVAHSEDASRPSTLADCCGSVPSEARKGLDTVAGITDVIGFNRYFGWYGNKVDALANELTRLHVMYPNQAISVGEYGAGGALTQHTDNPLGGPIHAFSRPHPEEFQSYLLEESWQQIEALPFVWASWVWNMFDFSNDARLEGDLIDTNDKGLVTFDRQTKKDAFYFFKANWSAEPVLRITGRRYVDRAYPVTNVRVYSNASEVSLTLGAKDLGSSKCQHGVCEWKNVELASGENTLTARSAQMSDSVQWRYLGKPGQFFIRAGNLAGGETVAGVEYGSDQFFTGGEGHDRDPPAASRGGSAGLKSPVANAADQVPYESYREGRFEYRVPVANGTYNVTLRFFEPVKDQAKGARVFALAAEGKQVVRSLDIAAEAGGSHRAVDKSFKVPVSDGLLNLSFEPKVGNAVVSALEITH